MSLEQLQKEAREEFAKVGGERFIEKNLLPEKLNELVSKAYLQGIRDAKGCVPEKRGNAGLCSPVTQKDVGKRDNYFYNLGREGTLEAITRLEENYD